MWNNEKRLQKYFAMFSMAVCLPAAAVLISGICMLLFAGKGAGTRDFVCYLASGKLLAHRANPYDSDAVLRIEREAGFPAEYRSMIMRNPPSALLPTLPLGYMSPRLGAIIWAWLSLGCFVVSVTMLWTMNGRPDGLRAILGYTFAPALVCLLANQITFFALLGFVLFVRLYKSRPFLAGVSLWLCALRPHLFLPFCVALVLWIVVTRNYRVLLGAVSALLAGMAIPILIDPMVWNQYFNMMGHHSGLDAEFIPCLSIALRLWLSPRSTWLQAIPSLVACAWAAAYYWKNRLEWDWLRHGSLLTTVSLISAPYAYFYDEALAIPAVMSGVARVRDQWMLGVLALMSAAIEIPIMIYGPSLHSAAYLFTGPAWLLWYLFATRKPGVPQPAVLAVISAQSTTQAVPLQRA